MTSINTQISMASQLQQAQQASQKDLAVLKNANEQVKREGEAMIEMIEQVVDVQA